MRGQKCWKFIFLNFLDYLTCWMFVETPLCFQFNLQDAVGPCFKVLLHVDKNVSWGVGAFGLQNHFVNMLCKRPFRTHFTTNEKTNKQINNQPNKQTNKQANKQTKQQQEREREQQTTNNKLQTTTTNKQHATNNKRQPCRRIGERIVPNAVWSDSASEFHGLWLC